VTSDLLQTFKVKRSKVKVTGQDRVTDIKLSTVVSVKAELARPWRIHGGGAIGAIAPPPTANFREFSERSL